MEVPVLASMEGGASGIAVSGYSGRGCRTKQLVLSSFFCIKYKIQASKSLDFDVKYIYANKEYFTQKLYNYPAILSTKITFKH